MNVIIGWCCMDICNNYPVSKVSRSQVKVRCVKATVRPVGGRYSIYIAMWLAVVWH